ncbi:MAG: hypothetical protein ACRDY7_14390 [Acidimicrobiia bacterium]
MPTLSARNRLRQGRRRPALSLAVALSVAASGLGAGGLQAGTHAAAATGPASVNGYWLVASDGGIFSYGNAAFHGSTGGMRLNQPILGMARTASGPGYWLVASDGGIFTFGDAAFFGSTGAIRLNQPVVGMAPTPSGRGYWLVASDGGIFTFGDAAFFGSGGNSGKTFAGMAQTPTGGGYWLATTGGEVMAFGDAPRIGSASTSSKVVAVSATPSGRGMWLAANDGGVFSLGDAGFFGSAGALRLNQPVVGFAPTTPAAPGAGPAGNPPGGGSQPGSTSTTAPSTTPTTAPNPSGQPMEVIAPPRTVGEHSDTNGDGQVGKPTAAIPSDASECGLPAADRTDFDPDIDHIGEASGMTASAVHDGVYWVIRDSPQADNRPQDPRNELYAVRVRSDGTVSSRPIPIPGSYNDDWEEVNYYTGPDGKGRLLIVESGTGMLAHRKIYEVAEPDPDADTATLLHVYDYAMPAGVPTQVNIEASFMHQGYLVLATKIGNHSELYRFESPFSASGTNVPNFIGELAASSVPSMVRISPDGKLLISASHQVVRLYRSPDGSLANFLGVEPACEVMAFPGGNVESGEFLSHREVVFLDELKRSYRLTIDG